MKAFTFIFKCRDIYRFSKLLILAASLVLSVDLAISIDLSHPSHILSSKRLQVSDALQIIRPEGVGDKTPPLTAQCLKIIDGLLTAADRRLASRQTQPVVHPSGDLQDFFDDVSAAVSNSRACAYLESIETG